jgi:hypothetical protein
MKTTTISIDLAKNVFQIMGFTFDPSFRPNSEQINYLSQKDLSNLQWSIDHRK